jgi:hypothetical protein
MDSNGQKMVCWKFPLYLSKNDLNNGIMMEFSITNPFFCENAEARVGKFHHIAVAGAAKAAMPKNSETFRFRCFLDHELRRSHEISATW